MCERTCACTRVPKGRTRRNWGGKGWISRRKFERKDLLPTLRGEILNLSGAQKRNVTRIFFFELSRGLRCLPLPPYTLPSTSWHVRTSIAAYGSRWFSSYVPDILFLSLWQLVRVSADGIIDPDCDLADGSRFELSTRSRRAEMQG